MAKLTLLFLAAFALALLLADASIYRTTITIDEEAENPREESCQEQMRRQQNLSQCRKYLEQQESSPRRYVGSENKQEHLRQCCDGLRQMKQQCRCLELREMMEQQMEREEKREMMEMASNILSKCGLQPMTCQFRYAAVMA